MAGTVTRMNKQQAIALWVAVANLALVFAFPPYDYLSQARNYVPTFGGFHFIGAPPVGALLNANFLVLEMIVILINAGIAWLLLRDGDPGERQRISRGQRAVLWLMGINLVLMLLFPPFENYYAITKAVLPSFDGFYFIFDDNAQRQIVTTLLALDSVTRGAERYPSPEAYHWALFAIIGLTAAATAVSLALPKRRQDT